MKTILKIVIVFVLCVMGMVWYDAKHGPGAVYRAEEARRAHGLRHCVICGGDVAYEATRCPHCGAGGPRARHVQSLVK